ncbi:MAG: hypothetical protein JSR76_07735 [Verrucomicrobia bacterium]|nr:hypothetical protein [Verrucomicrobiota bacterium]
MLNQFFLSILSCVLITSSLSATILNKDGLLSCYAPHDASFATVFLPYNPRIIVAGDCTFSIATAFASQLSQASIFCITPEESDIENLKRYEEQFPNLHFKFACLHLNEGSALYYGTRTKNSDYFKPGGSLIKPLDPYLMGKPFLTQTTSLSTFCQSENISKIDCLYLNTGGTELKILKETPALVQSAIIVYVKSYHRPLRANLDNFKQLQNLMSQYDFILASHYTYDNGAGDALFVKRRYFEAVFQRTKF